MSNLLGKWAQKKNRFWLTFLRIHHSQFLPVPVLLVLHRGSSANRSLWFALRPNRCPAGDHGATVAHIRFILLLAEIETNYLQPCFALPLVSQCHQPTLLHILNKFSWIRTGNYMWSASEQNNNFLLSNDNLSLNLVNSSIWFGQQRWEHFGQLTK